jgi:hypothetical protein
MAPVIIEDMSILHDLHASLFLVLDACMYQGLASKARTPFCDFNCFPARYYQLSVRLLKR